MKQALTLSLTAKITQKCQQELRTAIQSMETKQETIQFQNEALQATLTTQTSEIQILKSNVLKLKREKSQRDESERKKLNASGIQTNRLEQLKHSVDIDRKRLEEDVKAVTIQRAAAEEIARRASSDLRKGNTRTKELLIQENEMLQNKSKLELDTNAVQILKENLQQQSLKMERFRIQNEKSQEEKEQQLKEKEKVLQTLSMDLKNQKVNLRQLLNVEKEKQKKQDQEMFKRETRLIAREKEMLNLEQGRKVSEKELKDTKEHQKTTLQGLTEKEKKLKLRTISGKDSKSERERASRNGKHCS